MKKLNLRMAALMLCCVWLLPAMAFAQSEKISASEIMDAIKEGKDLNYKNVTVSGTLDFTFMNEKADDMPTRRWWDWNSSNSIKEDIKVSVNFVNCTFEGDVLAYFHDERTEHTFVANFERDVTFRDCTFDRDALFKYSEFEQSVDFSGSIFSRESNFKYAEFEEAANFARCDFDEEGNFKYAEFDRGLDFSGTLFQEDLNLKYSDIRGDFLIDNVEVKGDVNTKYTEVNGRSFSFYAVNRDDD